MTLLFEIEPEPVPLISGLSYIPDFITAREERALMDEIDAQPWMDDLKRRVQHYGYRYDYKARGVFDDSYLGPLPEFLGGVAGELCPSFFSKHPDQAIVNEYLPGQGISAHIDCAPCFGEVIASLSLGSAVIMQFIHPETNQKESLYLEERSLLVLSGDARYLWQHCIPARKSDVVQGVKIERSRRLSVTFRSVLAERAKP